MSFTADLVQAHLEHAVKELKDEMQFLAERAQALVRMIEAEPQGNARVRQLAEEQRELNRRILNLSYKLGLVEQALSYPVQ